MELSETVGRSVHRENIKSLDLGTSSQRPLLKIRVEIQSKGLELSQVVWNVLVMNRHVVLDACA